jgi:hypothetical protein
VFNPSTNKKIIKEIKVERRQNKNKNKKKTLKFELTGKRKQEELLKEMKLIGIMGNDLNILFVFVYMFIFWIYHLYMRENMYKHFFLKSRGLC